MSQDGQLHFFISKKNPLLVVAISGSLSQDSLSEFEKCRLEMISDPDIRFVAIDLSNLGNITLDAIPSFVQFQKGLRDQKIEFRISGLSDDLRVKLQRMGVIRFPEISKSLKDSLALGIKTSTHPTKSEESLKKAS